MAKRKRKNTGPKTELDAEREGDSERARAALLALGSVTRGTEHLDDDLISFLFVLRMLTLEATSNRRDLPINTCVELIDVIIEDLGGEIRRLTTVQKWKIARLAVYCSGCCELEGGQCNGYPGRDWRGLLRRRFFCLRYRPAEDRGDTLERNIPHIKVGFWGKLFILFPILLLLLIFLSIFAILRFVSRLVFRTLLFVLTLIARVIVRGVRAVWRTIGGGLRWVGGGIARALTSLRDTGRRWSGVIDAVRSALTGPLPSERVQTEPVPDSGEDADALARELDEVRREAEALRADLEQRTSLEGQELDEHRAELSARVVELEERLTATQEKLQAVQDRARKLGRLARQQQAILDGKLRSARRLAAGKRRLGKQLREAAHLLPEDAVIDATEGDVIEGLLEVAEAELEERDAEVITMRADLDDALTELEVYESLLIAAEQRARELAAPSASAAKTAPSEESVLVLPRRIGDVTVTTTRRFDRELERLPAHLKTLASVRLQRLLENPELLERRTYVVDEVDRAAYRLPEFDGLRKCRLNLKYRMFVVPRAETVELVSVAKHA